MTDVAFRSTYNPKTKRYFGFPDNYVPDPIHYRKSLWFNAGIAPNTWENIRKAAPILKKAGHPVGLGMSNELDSNMMLMSLLYCYGSSLQDAKGNPAIDNKGTVARPERDEGHLPERHVRRGLRLDCRVEQPGVPRRPALARR